MVYDKVLAYEIKSTTDVVIRFTSVNQRSLNPLVIFQKWLTLNSRVIPVELFTLKEEHIFLRRASIVDLQATLKRGLFLSQKGDVKSQQKKGCSKRSQEGYLLSFKAM